MAPITLLNKGSLIARMGELQSKLDNTIPIDYIMDWIHSKLKESKIKTSCVMSDRVIVLLSKTGSGKSSSIAPNIYLRYFDLFKKQIIITQPRVLTAMEIPKDISGIESYKKPNSKGLSIELYRNLGYQTQQFVRKPTERGILFTTTGILLQFLKTMSDEQFIKKFKFIIIDEAHDRSLDVDLILLMMKRLIKRNLNNNPPFLILMSATLNVQEYCSYFETKTVFEVSGQSKPIDVHYPIDDAYDIYQKTCQTITHIDSVEEKNIPVKDIIVFMAKVASITRMAKAVNGIQLNRKLLVLSITAEDINTGSQNYKLLVQPLSKEYYRKVIISTNVAETGLTLDGLRYCIDTALMFSNEYNPRYGCSVLMTKPITSSMTLQRKGRVGRKEAGVFYPLYTEKTFNDMIVDNTPSVLTEEITNHLLTLLINEPVKQFKDLPVYDMLTPPSDDSINHSLEKLFILGAIDSNGQTTTIGKTFNVFRKLPIESNRMIISGLYHGIALKELIQLAVLITLGKKSLVLSTSTYDSARIFNELFTLDAKCDSMNYNRLRYRLLVGCEWLELLLIYQRFLSRSNLSIIEHIDWCEEIGLNYYKLISATETMDEYYWTLLEELKINPNDFTPDLYADLKRSTNINDTTFVDHVSKLKKCIYEGYKLNTLTWSGESYLNRFGKPVTVDSKMTSQLSYQKIGANFDQDKPKSLICREVTFAESIKTGLFEFKANLVSVLDGFVDIDNNITRY